MQKLIISILFSVLTVGIIFGQETSPDSVIPEISKRDTMITTNRCFPKGGLGIIDEHLYIVVKSAKSAKNELVIKPMGGAEVRWTGQAVTNSEVIIFYKSKVLSTENLPDHFDLSEAVVVSFERDKVRFYDFQKMFGGFYERITTDGF